MKNILPLLLCLSFFLSSSDMSAQGGRTVFRHTVSGTVLDSLTREPVAGAFVSLINRYGSFHVAADENGRFRLSLAKDGDQLILEATGLGYRIARKVFDADRENIDAGEVLMSPDPEELDAAVVRGRREFFKEKGDTVIYFPSTVYQRKNATALEAMLKMPGVKSSPAGISVKGETVERTYVNGRLIFGKDNPLYALDNIDAKDVASILAYDEYDEIDRMQRGEHARKRKVLNVITFDFFDQSLILSVIAGGGADLQENSEGKHQGRYIGGAALKFFSERRQLLLDYVGNNSLYNNNVLTETFGSRARSNYSENPYEQTNRLKVEYADRIKDKWDINGRYDFNSKFLRTGSVQHNDYFATDVSPRRMYADTSSGKARNGSHSGSLTLENFNTKTYTKIAAYASFDNDGNTSSNVNTLDITGGPKSVSSTVTSGSSRSGQVYSNADFMLFTKAGTFNLNAVADIRNAGLDDFREERYSDALYDKTIFITGSDRLRSFTGTFSYVLPEKDFGSLTFGCGTAYRYDRKFHLAKDNVTGNVDSTLSRNYTDDCFRNNVYADYSVRIKDLDLSAGLKYENTTYRKHDVFYGLPRSGKMVDAVLPSLSLSYKSLSFSYETSANAPALEMLSERLDYRNPMYLTVGNPGLEQEYVHDFSLSWFTMNPKRQDSFSLNVSFSLTDGLIGARTRYLAADEYLPEYRYQAREGAVLTSYENLDGAVSSYTSLDYSIPLRKIQCFMSAYLKYEYARIPMYMDNVLSISHRHLPNMGLSLFSNFSGPVGFSVSYSGAYSHNLTSAKDSYSSIVNSVEAGVRADFLKRMFADVSYELYDDRSISESGPDVSNHKLDISLGCRLFKNERGEISINVYDALNRNTGFSYEVFADKINKTWNYYTPRFTVLKFTYKFTRNR